MPIIGCNVNDVLFCCPDALSEVLKSSGSAGNECFGSGVLGEMQNGKDDGRLGGVFFFFFLEYEVISL